MALHGREWPRPFLIGMLVLFLPMIALAKEENFGVSEKGKSPLRVAIYPVENLSSSHAPLNDIRRILKEQLSGRGVEVLGEATLETFMARHRIRYAGGIDQATAMALRNELRVDALLLTTLELYDEVRPPKIALFARLITTGPSPSIVWAEGIGLSGDDAPGLLGLGLIEDPGALMKKALNFLIGSLTRALSAHTATERRERSSRARFAPTIAYKAPFVEADRTYKIAILPFLNRSNRKYAGEILALHFMRAFQRFDLFETVEPGMVRHQLLGLRVILEEGLSLAHADALFAALDADLLVHGRVMAYEDVQGGGGNPRVDFSTLLIERKSRKTVWASTSHNAGDDGVLLFDWGRLKCAHALASQMVQSIGEKIGGKGTSAKAIKIVRGLSKDSL